MSAVELVSEFSERESVNEHSMLERTLEWLWLIVEGVARRVAP